jgi:hypothetical protein
MTMNTTEIVPASVRPSLATSKAVRIRGLRPSDTTYLLTQCILAAHGRGEVVAMISPFAEGAERLHKAGVDMGRILLSVPDSPAMAAEIVEMYVDLDDDVVDVYDEETENAVIVDEDEEEVES